MIHEKKIFDIIEKYIDEDIYIYIYIHKKDSILLVM